MFKRILVQTIVSRFDLITIIKKIMDHIYICIFNIMNFLHISIFNIFLNLLTRGRSIFVPLRI